MPESGLENYGVILLFAAAAVLFAALGLAASSFLAPSKPNREKLKSYESGEEPMKDARIQYSPGYFIIGLIFLLFEVEIVFLFPWALIFDNETLNTQSNGWWSILSIAEMFLFILVLLAGLAFVWKKGFLDWPKPKFSEREYKSGIPDSLYSDINSKYERK